MLILDTSGSMGEDVNGGNPTTTHLPTRKDTVKTAAKTLLDNPLLATANVGLMRYSTNTKTNATQVANDGDQAHGGMVVYPVSPVSTNRTQLKTEIDNLTFAGPTPLAETLYESYLYFSGGSVLFGDSSLKCSVDAYNAKCPDANIQTSKSVGPSRAGGVINASGDKYQSPITGACQKNFVLFLTDGEGTSDYESIQLIRNLTGKTCTISNSTTAATADCLQYVAEYMNASTTDLNSSLSGNQTVATSFIVYGTDAATSPTSEIGKAAAKGGGKVYQATDPTALDSAFSAFVNEVTTDSESSFTSPAVAVNAFNKTQVLEDLYIALFKPSQYTHWNGNLKKYKLRNGKVVGRDPSSVTTVSTTSAVDASGFLDDSSHDFWELTTDTTKAFTERGGVAQQIPAPSTRKVYTYIGTNKPSSPVSLTGTNQAFTTANTLITDSILGTTTSGCVSNTTVTTPPTPVAMTTIVPTTSKPNTLAFGVTNPCKNNLISWIRGDTDSSSTTTADVRHIMGDPIHSQPSVVIYGVNGATTIAQDNDAVVYIATNDGILHAFNVTDGTELWSYIPQENLGDLLNIWTNATATTKHYALDGDIRILKYDENGNGKVDGANDRVFLYMSQGRGGDNYYALDITDKNTPKFMWALGQSPSSLGNSSAVGLPSVNGVINKSWSTPVIARVNASGISGITQNSQKLVLIFGAGYDDYNETNQDFHTADTYGNGIYMFDAVTGSLLWSQTKGSGAFSKMTHAIPSIVSVLDINADSYADRMYVGDMAGQLWRFDIYNGATSASSLVTGGVIASLGEKGQSSPLARSGTTPGDIVNNRKFYSPPDVAKIVVSGGPNYYNVAIGSGDRAHPKSNTTTLDRFYSIRDYKLTAQTQTYYDGLTPIKDSDLSVTDGSAAISNTNGWKVVLNAKEKALAQSITVNGAILFTTYEPNIPVDVCAASTGTGRAYTLKTTGEKYFSTISETFNTSGIPAKESFFETANIIKTMENETAASSSSSGSTSSGSSSSSSSSTPSTLCTSGIYILGNCATASTRIKTTWSESGAN